MNVQIDTNTLAKIQEIMEAKKIQHHTIRIFMKGMKCGGPIFGIVMDPMKEGDVAYEYKGIRFVTEQALYDQYGDFAIEYASGGFAVVPKNVAISKGCVSCGNCSS